jgi:hypothetical protein
LIKFTPVVTCVFTTRDLKRCRLMAGFVAPGVQLLEPVRAPRGPRSHREAITSRPLLLRLIGRQTRHAGRTSVTITSSDGEHHRARQALTAIAGFFAELRQTAKQLTTLERWYHILSQALKKYLRGILVPPRQLTPPGVAQLRLKAASSGSPRIRQLRLISTGPIAASTGGVL